MPADPHTAGLGASVRDESSRPLRAGRRAAPRARGRQGARIVSVSSRAHLRSPVVFDDIQFLNRAYEPWDAYAQSKTANVLFAVEATRRWKATASPSTPLQPGTVRSNLQRYITDEDLERTRGHIEGDNGSFQLEDPRAGSRNLGAARDLTAAAGNRRPLLRRLQPSRTKPTRHRSWRRPLRARP